MQLPCAEELCELLVSDSLTKRHYLKKASLREQSGAYLKSIYYAKSLMRSPCLSTIFGKLHLLKKKSKEICAHRA